MSLTVNQQGIVDASTKVLADIFSQFTGTPEDWIAAITASATKAFAAQTTKATPLQIVGDSFSLATATAAEIGDPKLVTLFTNLQKAEQDAVAGEILATGEELYTIYKELKAGV